MDSTSLGFLKTILETPSPSGYEADVQRFVRDYVKDFADEVRTDLHGNVIVVKNPDSPLRVMLAGHCDQIGLIVQHIDDDGFLYVQQIGGWDPQVLIGQRMTVWTDAGPVFGVIGRKPIHLLTEDERKQVPKMKDLWLDIGATNKEDAIKMVRVGDAVTVELGFHESRNNRAVSPAMDDKAGCWVVIEALRRACESGKLKCGLYAVSTVQEELGLRGGRTSAFGIDPQVGVAVDVTHATDCPTIDKKEEGDVRLGHGPVIHRGPNMNHKVVERLIAAANRNEILYQLAACGRATGTDANAIQVSRAGVATGLVSIPNRYMHSPIEMVSLDDLDRAADLLARFAENIDVDAEFTP
ncbi:MAG: M42 family metallopeptidase [Thermoguttaceae bacterium]